MRLTSVRSYILLLVLVAITSTVALGAGGQETFVYIPNVSGRVPTPPAFSRVSVASNGTQANDASLKPSLSGNGRYVAFESLASNLVSGDTNGLFDIFVYDHQTRQTTRVSVNSNGTQGNGASRGPVISADGRYVAFSSVASNLVDGDTNVFCTVPPSDALVNCEDVFVHDRLTGQTTRVSVDSNGNQGNSSSRPVSLGISADGRIIAFTSQASNLVSGDTNEGQDVFVHDRETRETTRVSVASDGTQGDKGSFLPALSADGRYVAFASQANNFVSGNGAGLDVYVHDRETRQTTLVSATNAALMLSIAISADGFHVAFNTDAPNVVSGDTDSDFDVFVHDRRTGETKLVSVAPDGTEADDHTLSQDSLALSGDGRYVVFYSLATNLVNNDNNVFCDRPFQGGLFSCEDVFVHDRQTGKTTLVSVARNGTQGNESSRAPAISADGRYIAFHSYATNLIAGDTNDDADVFVWEREEVAP